MSDGDAGSGIDVVVDQASNGNGHQEDSEEPAAETVSEALLSMKKGLFGKSGSQLNNEHVPSQAAPAISPNSSSNEHVAFTNDNGKGDEEVEVAVETETVKVTTEVSTYEVEEPMDTDEVPEADKTAVEPEPEASSPPPVIAEIVEPAGESESLADELTAVEPSKIEEAEEDVVLEEVEETHCEKKIISMDTTQKDEASEAQQIETDVSMETEEPSASTQSSGNKESEALSSGSGDADDETSAPANIPEEAVVEEEEEAVAEEKTPVRRGRGRVAGSAKKTPQAKTPTSTSRSARGEKSSESDAVNEEDNVAEEKEEESEPVVKQTPSTSGRRGRPPKSASAKKPKVEEEEEAEETEANDTAEEPEPEDETPRRGRSTRKAAESAKDSLSEKKKTPAKKTPVRGRKAAAAEEDSEDAGSGSDEKSVDETQEDATPTRGRRSRATAVETPKETKPKTPATAKKSAKAEKEENEAEPEDDDTETDATETSEAPVRRRGRPPKSANASPAKSSAPTPSTSASGGRPGRKAKQAKEEHEEEEEEEEEPEESASPARRAPRAAKATTTPATATPKVLKTPTTASKTPTRGRPASSVKKPKAGPSQTSGEHDPYDLDTEMDQHPEPLKNISMEVQSFGEVKYAKVGSGNYAQTERTAESRVNNLSDLAPKNKERRSLADFTPGRKKATPPSGGSKSAPQARRGRPPKKAESDEEEEEEEEQDDDEAMEVDGTATPRAKTTGTKKRKAASPIATPSTAKRTAVTIPQLGAEDQWTVDHPGDEHAPHELGARVYASFNKVFYPAVVAGNRDGLGRFMVKFTEDGVIKEVPSDGLIPLRALLAEKECMLSGTEKDVRVVQSPNAASAVEWEKAIFQVEEVDEDGEGNGNISKVTWNELSLNIADWKDYVNKKATEATKVMTDNIASTEDRTSRRSKVGPAAAAGGGSQTPLATPKTPAAKKPRSAAPTPVKTPKSAKKTPANKRRTPPPKLDEKPENVEEYVQDEVKEEEADEEKKIFDGMLFILTSANRPSGNDGSSTVFRKKFMTDYIGRRGGEVVDDVHEVDRHPDKKPFLISDTHYRTHKYLAAMARTMPCVSHEWINKCQTSDELVDYTPYLLPAGVSILDQRTYPLFSPTSRATLLDGKTVMVHSNHQPTNPKALSFVQIWEPMVILLGGKVVDSLESGNVDVMLTDQSASAELVEKAKAQGLDVVSSEWLIQAIIMSSLPPVDAHARFRHDSGTAPAVKPSTA